jgi:hypothetical protein
VLPSHATLPDRRATGQVNIKKPVDAGQGSQTVRERRGPDGIACPSCAAQQVSKRSGDDPAPARSNAPPSWGWRNVAGKWCSICWPLESQRGSSPSAKTPSFQGHLWIEMRTALMPGWSPGDPVISLSPMGGASALAMQRATVFVKCRSIPWQASGLCCGAGCARIGASRQSNSRYPWVASRLCTPCASVGKRCGVHSWSYWAHKTPASNMSDPPILLATIKHSGEERAA